MSSPGITAPRTTKAPDHGSGPRSGCRALRTKSRESIVSCASVNETMCSFDSWGSDAGDRRAVFERLESSICPEDPLPARAPGLQPEQGRYSAGTWEGAGRVYPAAVSPTRTSLTLSERRGLALRSLVLPDSSERRGLALRRIPSASNTCSTAIHRQQMPEHEPHRRAASRTASKSSGSAGEAFCTKSSGESFTMGEYRRAMKIKHRKPTGQPKWQSAEAPNPKKRTLPSLPSPSNGFAKPVLAVKGNQPVQAASIRILFALLLVCKALLLLPITIVKALISPKPPWCPRTPSSAEANRKWSILRSPSFSVSPFGGSNSNAMEALTEPCTP
jgi:hypothetical protein